MQMNIDHLRQWIGRESVAQEQVTSSIVERFNATFNRDGDTSAGAAAPLMLHWCLAPPAAFTAELGPDGHPARGGFLPPVPLPRRMWAGGALEIQDEIRIGETVARRSVISDVTVKEGRTGTLCFVTVAHEVTSDGRPILSERQDIVYRAAETLKPAAAAEATTAKPAPAADGSHRQVIAPTPPLLFRYSALTFNGHRIHYDEPYAREEESYPGLVVHGPLQATLLAHHAEKIKGRRPERFSFRSLSPLFHTADFAINADNEDDGLKLWTARIGGPMAMEARAQWQG